MAGPWEKYGGSQEQSQSMPWEKYQAAPIEEPLSESPRKGGVERAVNLGASYVDARTFGLGPKIAAAVGSVPAKAVLEAREAITGIDAPSLSDLYKSGVDLYAGPGKQAFEDDAALAIAASLAGGLKTGGQLAKTKAGQKVADWAGRGGIGQRIVKGGLVAAPAGAVYGAGTAEVGDELFGAAKGGAGAAVLGAALPAAGSAISRLNTKTVVPSSEEIREAGGQLFKIADQKGGVLKPEISDKFFDKVLSIRPQSEAGRVFKGQSPVSAILDDIPSLKGKPLTLQAAKEVDEALGDLAYSTMDKFGKLNADGKKFLDMQTALRRTIENADESMVIGGKEGFEAVKEARKLWSTSLRLRDIEKIIDNAQSFEQPATAIKTGFRTLLRNPDRLKGYTPEEVKAIKKAAQTGIVTDMFRLAGSGLVPIGAGISGTVAGGPAGGAAAGVAGYALQQGAKSVGSARQIARAKDAAKTVAERSGMVQTEQRIPLPTLREILRLPPAQAKEALKGFKQ
jgi:hypothetical protein